MNADAEVPKALDDAPRGFALSLGPRCLNMVVYPVPEGGRAPDAADVLAAIADFPVDTYSTDLVREALTQASGETVEIASVDVPEDRDDWVVTLSPSQMVAYLLPGAASQAVRGEEATATEVAADDIRADLAALGVTHGIREDVLSRFAPSGFAHTITVVAEGQRPAPGSNARIEVLFGAASTHTPIIRPDGSVDFHAAASQSVDAGSVLARRHPPVRGVPGRNLLGQEVPVQNVLDRTLGPMSGRGTEVRGDLLVATRPGQPVFRGVKVEVLPVFEVKGDVNYAVGSIDFNGDVIISGDVDAGFSIRAEGSVTVRGVVDHASITAGYDIITGGIVGDEHTSITAGGNLRAQYIHGVTVKVQGTVTVNRELVSCVVEARKVETSPNGRIVGGEVVAREEVSAGTIGSPQAVPTQVTALSGSPKTPAVIRAGRGIHAGTLVRVGHCSLRVVDDLRGSSFWEFNGDISRLGPASPAPKAA
jgi:uncharacterized protein (DUF342 family)